MKRKLINTVLLLLVFSSVTPIEATRQDELLFKHTSTGNLPGVKAALRQGAKVNTLRNMTWPDKRFRVRRLSSPLTMAVLGEHRAVATYLLKKGANVNWADAQGETILIHAIRYNKFKMVKLLVEAGAYVNKTKKLATSPLLTAMLAKNRKMIGYLKTRGARLTQKEKLILTIYRNDTNKLKEILKRNTSVNIYYRRETPLIIASRLGHLAIVELLLKHGAHTDFINPHRGSNGLSPLLEALRYNKVEVIKLLLKHGANPDKQKNRSHIPLLWSLSIKRYAIARVLVQNGADINVFESDGIRSALGIVAGRGHVSMTLFLLKAGANVNLRHPDSQSTPLMKAVESRQYATTELLLRYGANIRQKNKSGKSALSIAQKQNDQRMLKLLRSSFPARPAKK